MTAETTEAPHGAAREMVDSWADAERAAALGALVVAIASTRRPPCVRWPDAGWISEDRTAQLDAAALCDHCPALTACRAYLAEHLEPSGVWAGTVPPTYPGGPRTHHTLARPTLPPDLDPGHPLDTLPTPTLAALAHALAGRGMPVRTIARLLGKTRTTIGAYLAAPPPPAPPTAADAARLAASIRTAAAAALDDDAAAVAELVRLAVRARDVGAHAAAGHASWADYLAHALAGAVPPPERRRPLALALVAGGLSTRAAGALTATPYGTVGRWMRAPTGQTDAPAPASRAEDAPPTPEAAAPPERPAQTLTAPEDAEDTEPGGRLAHDPPPPRPPPSRAAPVTTPAPDHGASPHPMKGPPDPCPEPHG